MNYSYCRENEDEFEAWVKIFKYIVAFGYIFFIIGFIFMYSAFAVAAYVSFPKYCGIKNSIFASYSLPGDIYNSDTNEMIQGCVLNNLAKYESGNIITALNILCPFIVVGLFLISLNASRVIKCIPYRICRYL